MPGCGGNNRILPGDISFTLTAEDVAEMEAHEKNLEALKDTDPAEYARITEPTNKLRRWLTGLRLKSHSK